MRLDRLVAPHLRYLGVLNRSPDTIARQEKSLRRFLRFLAELGVEEAEDLGKDVVLGFQEDLAYATTPRGTLLKPSSQASILVSVRGFLGWLYREDYLAVDLARVLVLPKQEKPLPKEVIEPGEMRRLLATPDLGTPIGYRDRAILEVFYSTGIRLNELRHLRVHDVDLDGGTVYVERGKGGKARVVPIGRMAAEVVRGYLLDARPALATDDTETLFLNRYGERLSKRGIARMVRRHVQRAGIRKRITPHCFRVTCTTGMLRGGANVRHLQEMLGHASVATLDPYLRVTINELKETHARFHPREQMCS